VVFLNLNLGVKMLKHKKIFILNLYIIFYFTLIPIVFAKSQMKIGLSADVVMLDPQLAQSGPDWTPQSLIWNRLVEYDNTMMDPIPSIAKSWEVSKDGKVWSFKIRKGITFHSGRELTSSDIVFSFKRGFEIGPKGRFAGYMVSVDSYKALSTYEFQVTLKHVDVTFLGNLAAPAAAIVDKDTIDKIRTEPIGSGPYEFVEWSPGEKTVYRKFNNYWDKKMLSKIPDEIVVIPIPEDQTRLANLQSGNVDIIDGVEAVFWAQIQNDPNTTLWGQELTASYKAVIFNFEKPPFKGNKLLRQAIAHAINKEAIHQTVFFGTGEVGCNLIPKSHWAYTEIACYDYNPEKAKELLKRSGYDTSRPIYFPTSSRPAYMRTAEVVQANLKDIGLKTDIEPQEWGYYVQETWISRKFEMQVAWYTREIDPDGLFSSVLRKEQGNNPMRYYNPAIETLFDGGKSVYDREIRKKHYEAIMNTAILDEMPIIKIQTIERKWASNKKIKDFNILPKGLPNYYDFKWGG
jgi:ABC-type transport system substrate-binding protein